jgi:hypothetical protein
MIDGIHAHNPSTEVVLLTMNVCIGPLGECRRNLADYYQVYRDVAADRDAPLLDLEPVWRNLLEKDPRRFDQLVPDGVHPNQQACDEVITPFIHEQIFR